MTVYVVSSGTKRQGGWVEALFASEESAVAFVLAKNAGDDARWAKYAESPECSKFFNLDEWTWKREDDWEWVQGSDLRFITTVEVQP